MHVVSQMVVIPYPISTGCMDGNGAPPSIIALNLGAGVSEAIMPNLIFRPGRSDV